MKEKLCIRCMTPEDVESVCAIENSSFTVPWSKESFQSLFSYNHIHSLVAEYSGRVCGFTVLSLVADEGEILNIATAEAFRNRGIASALMAYGENFMAENGAEHFFLEVRQANAAARSLYKARGYKEIGIRKNYYKCPVEAAIIMRKEA